MTSPKPCSFCGATAGSRWAGLGPVLLCALLWVVPAAFLYLGTYPFGILLVTILTVWAVQRLRRVCSHCGR